MMSDRPGTPNSGEATVTSTNGTDAQTVVNVRDNALFEANQLVIECDPSGTYSNLELTIHDAPDGTNSPSDLIKTIEALNPGDVRSYDDLMMRDFHEDVLVETDGSQDADVHVYMDGQDITG